MREMEKNPILIVKLEEERLWGTIFKYLRKGKFRLLR